MGQFIATKAFFKYRSIEDQQYFLKIDWLGAVSPPLPKFLTGLRHCMKL